jgi:FkbM family methyltransferase
MPFVNESAVIIKTPKCLNRLLRLVKKHITPDSVVLELGAKYGMVSCAINEKLNNSLNQVSVEPDTTVHACLESNMHINKCKFNITKGVISTSPTELLKSKRGGRIITQKSKQISIKTYLLEQVEELHKLKFTTLVADCNGALQNFFEENPILYTQLTTVIFNKSLPKLCNYTKIKEKLAEHSFKQVCKGRFEVWKKV